MSLAYEYGWRVLSTDAHASRSVIHQVGCNLFLSCQLLLLYCCCCCCWWKVLPVCVWWLVQDMLCLCHLLSTDAHASRNQVGGHEPGGRMFETKLPLISCHLLLLLHCCCCW
jgi:hypothetical protein